MNDSHARDEAHDDPSTSELIEALATTLEMYAEPGDAVSWRIEQARRWLAGPSTANCPATHDDLALRLLAIDSALKALVDRGALEMWDNPIPDALRALSGTVEAYMDCGPNTDDPEFLTINATGATLPRRYRVTSSEWVDPMDDSLPLVRLLLAVVEDEHGESN